MNQKVRFLVLLQLLFITYMLIYNLLCINRTHYVKIEANDYFSI